MIRIQIFVFLFSVLVLSSEVRAQAQTPGPAPTQLQFALSYPQAVERAESLKLAEERQWLLLGHYKKTIFGSWKSQISDAKFFVSREGRTDPKAELNSLLAVLYSPAPSAEFDLDPRCQFPARLHWLKTELKLTDLNEDEDPILKNCAMYRRFRSVIKADSLSFVFSSYYANSPGSAFGHTFFRINKKSGPDGKRSELLDHGVGYAAQVTISNPMLYAIFGLTGFFKGIFSNLPYYYKVREYNDFESRDLWSYDLNLSATEVDMVARHLWEVGNSYFDYYFFTQNCAYHMLTVLEAAAPRYHILDRVPMYVIPVDAVKAVNQEPDLVSKVSFRPALRSVFLQRYNQLSDENQAVFRDYMTDLELSRILNQKPESHVPLLDTALDYADILHPENLTDPSSKAAEDKNKILRVRASIDQVSENFSAVLPEMERPDLGHGSARAALGYGTNYLGSRSIELEMRFALHDLLDPHLGYPRDSQLEFFHLRAQFDSKEKRFQVNDFDIFRVAAMNPWNLFMQKPSWRVHIGLHRFQQGACESECLTSGFGIGGGYAHYLDSGDRILGYALMEAQGYYDVHFLDHPYKLSAGPTLGLLIQLHKKLKWMAEQSYFEQAVKAQQPENYFKTELRFDMANNWDLGARYEKKISEEQSFLMLYHFY